ncbi:AraC family transcriptional regulator [Flavobacteriaceae bacterium 3-367]|uniref:AraC family transcriptional regulator n=1 Tax=Eudoraea algarum TaxID=3417568 RepID=UPI00326B4825
MDILSDILEKIRLSSVVYFKSDFSPPWGMDIPKGPFAQFHLVTQGSCLARIGGETFPLEAGDVLVFPMGGEHWLADQETSKRENGPKVVRAIMNGKPLFQGQAAATTLVCGHFDFDRTVDHPLLKELPEFIHISQDEKKELSWLQGIADLVIEEAEKKWEGSQLISNKLGEVLFVHTLRAYFNRGAKSGFVAALQDRRIGKALREIHNAPEANWQLLSLARIAGMSRTGFSKRFKDLLGDTPLNYITHWRMLRARELLILGSQSVGEIAHAVGYSSEAAFNRVFKKRMALTPLKFRQSRA